MRDRSMESQLTTFKRNPDGTFKKGSQLAHDLGVQGGHAAHDSTTTHEDGVSHILAQRSYDTN
jgi:hypothetical protein